MRPARVLLAAILVALAATPASAHRLKLFATVEAGTIAGYGFFIGGGRPQGADIVVRDAGGAEVWRGTTDMEGAFAWRPPAPGDFALTIDARDGHVAEARIAADRFGGAATAAAVAAPPDAAPAAGGSGGTGAVDDAALAAMIERAVDEAVARQTRPLLEAYAEAEGRIRFNDVAGGIGMIAGLAGLGLWLSARRRPPGPGAGR